MASKTRIVVALSGASGVGLGLRLIECLKAKEHEGRYEVHAVLSRAAEKIAAYEEVDLAKLKKISDAVYCEEDIEACIASSSFPVDAMVVVPCSMKTLSAIANGYSDNLIARAAENVLKLGRKLVVSPRDTPLSLAALENMTKLKTAGALICPPIMAYYYGPKTLKDADDFYVGKLLDCLGIEHKLYKRWCGK